MNLSVPVIGILRGLEAGFIKDIIGLAFENGLQALEVTYNTEQASQIISQMRLKIKEGFWLGMGTLRNLEEAKIARDAGAMFFVTPNLDEKVIDFAQQNLIPIVVGAATPTEIYRAWSLGATLVKVFPGKSLGGPDYIKELRGPFENIPLVAVGGVNLNNLEDYFRAGTRAVGVTGELFGRQALANKDLDEIALNIRTFTEYSCRYWQGKN